jgi:hypothetical protein
MVRRVPLMSHFTWMTQESAREAELSTMVTSFSSEVLSHRLKLQSNEEPLCVHNASPVLAVDRLEMLNTLFCGPGVESSQRITAACASEDINHRAATLPPIL